jgi:hypothetical protein
MIKKNSSLFVQGHYRLHKLCLFCDMPCQQQFHARNVNPSVTLALDCVRCLVQEVVGSLRLFVIVGYVVKEVAGSGDSSAIVGCVVQEVAESGLSFAIVRTGKYEDDSFGEEAELVLGAQGSLPAGARISKRQVIFL